MGKINIFTDIIYLENWKEDLFDFIASFDAEASGENGESYTLEVAREKGFTNNIEYWIAEGEKLHPHDIGKVIQHVLKALEETYPDETAFTLTSFEEYDPFIVSFAFL